MAGADGSVDETRTLISNSVRNQAHIRSKLDFHGTSDSEDVAREPSRLGYENHHAHARKEDKHRSLCVISGVNFAVWTLRIHILSRLSQSGYDPDSIRIDFGCSVDKASKHAISIDYNYH